MKQAKRSRNPANFLTEPKRPAPSVLTERFHNGGGWGVSVVRGSRQRAAFPSNLAKRDGAVADLKEAAKRNKAVVWGTYENQKSTLGFAHDDPGCPNKGIAYTGVAAKLARDQLPCGCHRRAAASGRALDIAVPMKHAEVRGGRLLSPEYRNNRSALRWRCADGHEFSMSWDDAHAGRWCPRCSDSRANALCKEILERLLQVKFEQEQTPDFLADASETNGLPGLLRFDGWCAVECLAFEHQGPQHFDPAANYYTKRSETNDAAARKKFARVQKYDAIKAAACVGEATMIIIRDISAKGYGFAQSPAIIETIITGVRDALPQDRRDAEFDTAVQALRTLDRHGWRDLIQPIFAASRVSRRLRRLAEQKGGRVIALIDDRRAVLECADGHRWEAAIGNVLGGTWCPVEGVERRVRSRRLPISGLRARLRGLGLRLDWTALEARAGYQNNQTPIPVVREACGGTFTRPLAKLHSRSRCPGCKGKANCTGPGNKGKRSRTLH